MYNLLVTSDDTAWDKDFVVFDVLRFLEHTDDRLKQRLKSLDDDVRAELIALPTLFAYEAPVGRDARVGWIRSVDRRDARLRIKFQFDPDVPVIPPAQIESLAWELGIDDGEMNRTHWAVKDPDLLGVLAAVKLAMQATGVRPYAPIRGVANVDQRAAPETPATQVQTLAEYLPAELRGRFEVLQHLGTGSFAAVYQVIDVESQERFALKVLNRTPDALARAGREVAAVALGHPNILKVVEHHPTGHWFLFPLAEGTLGQLQSWGRLSSSSTTEVACACAEALIHAHAADFLHRDLHPENILRHDGRWKITDWGLAVARDQGRLTRTRSVGGTVTWTAPEQLRSLKDADERSDLFSVGRIVEWLATGRVPEPTKPGTLPANHPLGAFVGASTRLNRDERPRSVREALQLIPGATAVEREQPVPQRQERTTVVAKGGPPAAVTAPAWIDDDNLTPFQNKVVAALRKRTDIHNEVNVLYAEIADELGDGIHAGDVHQALIQLNEDGFFPGKPYFDSDQFNGRFPK